MQGIFVDTSAWFAMYVPDDKDHDSAVKWSEVNSHPLLTTDFVIDELLTLFRRRGERRRAASAGHDLLNVLAIHIEWVSPSDFESAWNVFRQFDDKNWSFTDCVSRVVMERLGVTQAFAFDEHFRQFGTVRVVP